ncbi:MAG TPA: hypothetical protein VGI81_14345 [Tepidisphaeraceae bacterium]
MSTEQSRSELVRKAQDSARRVEDRLRQYEDDLSRVAPGDVQGGQALREAVESAERLTQLLENSPNGHPAPDDEDAS